MHFYLSIFSLLISIFENIVSHFIFFEFSVLKCQTFLQSLNLESIFADASILIWCVTMHMLIKCVYLFLKIKKCEYIL